MPTIEKGIKIIGEKQKIPKKKHEQGHFNVCRDILEALGTRNREQRMQKGEGEVMKELTNFWKFGTRRVDTTTSLLVLPTTTYTPDSSNPNLTITIHQLLKRQGIINEVA